MGNSTSLKVVKFEPRRFDPPEPSYLENLRAKLEAQGRLPVSSKRLAFSKHSSDQDSYSSQTSRQLSTEEMDELETLTVLPEQPESDSEFLSVELVSHVHKQQSVRLSESEETPVMMSVLKQDTAFGQAAHPNEETNMGRAAWLPEDQDDGRVDHPTEATDDQGTESPTDQSGIDTAHRSTEEPEQEQTERQTETESDHKQKD